MMRHWRTRVAGLAVAIAAALAGVAGVRAARLEAVPPPDAARETGQLSGPDAHHRAATDPALIEATANRNPFDPERRRGGAFRLPQDREQPVAVGPRDRAGNSGPVRLVGTAVTGDGKDFVVCAVGREPPRIVRLGGRCGDLMLESVERGSAELTDPAGERVVLEVPKAGSR